MADPQIEKLLIVQDRDIALQKIQQEIRHIPLERSAIEEQIASEQVNIETAELKLKEKEVLRHELDSEVKAKESAIAKFRTQQLEVKKNEEYRALTSQIQQNEAEISDLEEREIELLLEIDSTCDDFNEAKAVIDARILEQNKQIALLNQREANLLASVDTAMTAFESARENVDKDYLSHYDRVKNLSKRPPYVARIEAHKCCACHLRVSNEIATTASIEGELHFCDQCAKIVYA